MSTYWGGPPNISCLPNICTGSYTSFKVWLPNVHWTIGAVSQTSLNSLLQNGLRRIGAILLFILNAFLWPSLRHRRDNCFILCNSIIFSFFPLMFNILNNTTFFNFLLPPSIKICVCRPFFTLFLFSYILSSDFVCTRRNFSSWPAAHEFILTRVFTHHFLGGQFFHILQYPPPPQPTMLLLDALYFHRVFQNLHCFAVSSPSCDWFLLELSSECLPHHASKCSPYPVPSLCIHFLHTLNPFFTCAW